MEVNELEFEMSDDLKLEELGYPPELYEVFKENYPDKKVLTQKDTASNDYFLFFLENVKSKKELEAIDSDTLTPKQRELLADKLLLFADVEKIGGKEVELEDPRAEMWAPEPEVESVELEANETVDVGRLIRENKKYEESAELYINEVAKLRKENQELREKARSIINGVQTMECNEAEYQSLRGAVRELATIFKNAKLGKIMITPETVQVLKEVGGK